MPSFTPRCSSYWKGSLLVANLIYLLKWYRPNKYYKSYAVGVTPKVGLATGWDLSVPLCLRNTTSFIPLQDTGSHGGTDYDTTKRSLLGFNYCETLGVLRINFFFLMQTFCHLSSFSFLFLLTTFRPNSTSGLLQVINRNLSSSYLVFFNGFHKCPYGASI